MTASAEKEFVLLNEAEARSELSRLIDEIRHHDDLYYIASLDHEVRQHL